MVDHSLLLGMHEYDTATRHANASAQATQDARRGVDGGSGGGERCRWWVAGCCGRRGGVIGGKSGGSGGQGGMMARRRKRFQYAQGGVPSADGTTVYFLALIDVLQDWNRWKKSENTIRGALVSSKVPEIARPALATSPFGERWARKGLTISAIPPPEYGRRMQDFVQVRA